MEIFGSNHRVFVRRGVGEQMIAACVLPTVMHGGGCGGALLVTVMIYLEFKAHLTSMATTAFWVATLKNLKNKKYILICLTLF